MPYRYNSNFCVLLETHISGNKAKNIIKKLDFDSWCISEAVGFAGGIWCLWNKVFWSIEPVSIQDQLIHMKIRDSANNIWWFTAKKALEPLGGVGLKHPGALVHWRRF
ncbi:hypothetical protein Ahy_B07g087982 [Arachis hypogaea]|uniref:Uncharacterized protein n=1 Tax=Arachis hypogaea TaxID=3818 RepID=A0A444YDF3_ARAHY|nr:hypothetical protein Ahy_B07g087982 [Arachis hypogaea]